MIPLIPTIFLLLTAYAVTALGQPLNGRVLVVQNSTSADSIALADYYIAQRSIPAANRCVITSPSTTSVTLAEYRSQIRDPIRACLNAAGPQNILYIVMTYGVPYSISDVRRFAVDSFVADIWDRYTTQVFSRAPSATHSYYADVQVQGWYFPPFESLASYRSNPKSTLIYSVWRLDGPSADLARGLVTKAIASEAAGGPAGQGCFDWRLSLGEIGDIGYFEGEWDIARSSQLLRQAGLNTTEDNQGPEIGSCPNAAFFSGWYSGSYNDVFTWNQGAIGWHLDSASAYNPREPYYWAPGAIAKGITVTTGSIDEPYLQGLVRPAGAFRNLLEGANVGDAFLRNTRWLKWEIVYFGDPLYRPFPGGKSPFNANSVPDSLYISGQRYIVGGVQQTTGTITLSSPAPPEGREFTLSTNYNNSVAVVPPAVTVPAGQTRVTFPIRSTPRTYNLDDVIYATSGALQLRNSITVAALLNSIGFEFGSLKGGAAMRGTVNLNVRAGFGGVTVALSSDNPAVTVPASVTVPAGQAGVQFQITTAATSTDADVTLTATYEGTTTTRTFRLTP